MVQLNSSDHPYWKSMLARLWWSPMLSQSGGNGHWRWLWLPFRPQQSKSCFSPSYFIEGNYIDCQIGSISSLSAARGLSGLTAQPDSLWSIQKSSATLPLCPFVERDKRETDREREPMGRPNHEIFRIRFI